MTPPSAGGIDALDPLLRKLATNRRLLVIGAHPDDEDTALLALVARGHGRRGRVPLAHRAATAART